MKPIEIAEESEFQGDPVQLWLTLRESKEGELLVLVEVACEGDERPEDGFDGLFHDVHVPKDKAVRLANRILAQAGGGNRAGKLALLGAFVIGWTLACVVLIGLLRLL